VVIEGVEPEIDGGRFPAKRVIGERVDVTADIYADGHDRLAAVLRHRTVGKSEWEETPFTALVNDRWEAHFTVTRLGVYEFTLCAWVDDFASWREGLQKKAGAGLDVASELLEGAALVRAAAGRADEADADWLSARADLIAAETAQAGRVEIALSEDLSGAMERHPDRTAATEYPLVLQILVERERARYGAWYEMFPRSAAAEPGRHGTLRDCEARLPYVAGMGFDVLYLPPIHPIGTTHRKGPNNTPSTSSADVGSPWAIGAADGGHTAIHPELGTMDDFDRLVATAREYGIEIALDIAFQCSPDHPWVEAHPRWFRWRPDGTIQYAENPPKKYQDIYPLNFETEDWRSLWEELKNVFLFWIGHGVSIFRVDNPHTKPFAFWEWVIAEVRREHPEAVFLSEAFTRPKVMRRLAKVGFSQSYTYFTWRNTKAELTEYLTELTRGESRWYMRPNLFANTPDIFHEYLQFGGRAAYQVRFVLAATLCSSYGIYGPPFELCETRAVSGTEEYLDSEKYQVRRWDLDRPGNLRAFITRVNEIRRDNPALFHDERLRFYPSDNEHILFYGKTTPDLENILLVVVNLDPHHRQHGWVEVPLKDLGLDPELPYQVHDLLGDARYLWHGSSNYVALDPAVCSAHVFRVRRHVGNERDFDYFA
jgi:starch synthase (maltosyl-transferring)